MINVAADSKVFLDRPSLQVCKQIVINIEPFTFEQQHFSRKK